MTWCGTLGPLVATSAGCLALTAVLAGPRVLAAEDGAAMEKEQAARHTLDPVCAWGRLADGQGVLVRCLAESEARPLLAQHERSLQPMEIYVRSVGEAKPDTGSLPEARPQLSKPKDRYVRCITENGGIEAERAAVTVKFLVRERGRAEGVSVLRRNGLGEAAAKCVAGVVDRRYVGFPEAAFVGATIEIELASRPIE